MLDNAGLEELYRRYAADLMSFAHTTLHSWDAAEDVVHDVFLQLWQRRGDMDTSRNLRGYLYTATYNAALNRLQRDKRVAGDSKTDESLTSVLSESLPVDEQLATNERDTQIRHAVAQLPERIRQVAILRWAHDLTRSEIAATLGTSEKTVANQLQRAKELLKMLLKPD
jgi:RNA polymerase sigma-70 factor (family 1)